jgi:hypothetical protein
MAAVAALVVVAAGGRSATSQRSAIMASDDPLDSLFAAHVGT